MENKDLKFIKKFYGEKMMHLCREFFPTILDEEGKLSQIMQNNFSPTKALYDQLIIQNATEDFRKFIVLKSKQNNSQSSNWHKQSPKEILDQAGYILYPECKTEDDIQSFTKYYAPHEQLCTFKGDRLSTCRVWFAVKKNVDKIRREDFTNPVREDEYGTSVISIQFSKCGGWLSIKNRYNHSVPNPDSTFGNRLDNIAPNLDYNFREYFKLPLNHLNGDLQLELNNFILADDDRYYHVNVKVDTFYFCENNIVISSGSVTQFDRTRDILMDNILLNKHKKSIEVLSSYFDYDDNCIQEIGKIANINEVKKENGEKDIIITNEKGKNTIFTVNKYNQIVGYSNENILDVKDNFFLYNEHIKNISLPNVKTIGNNFLQHAYELENVNFPKVEKIGDDCMRFCNRLETFYMPSIKKVGKNFLKFNRSITEFIAPQLTTIDENFLYSNVKTKNIVLPSVSHIGDNFLTNNIKLEYIDLPSVEKIGKDFLVTNEKIVSLNFPKLKYCGSNFLQYNFNMKNINLPSLEFCDKNFLMNNLNLTEVHLPNLKACGDKFLCLNSNIKVADMPNLEKCGTWFLSNNLQIPSINFPNLREVKNHFMEYNNRITSINLPNLQIIGSDFMAYNESVKSAYLPKLIKYDDDLFMFNDDVTIYAPKCKTKDSRFAIEILVDEKDLLTK